MSEHTDECVAVEASDGSIYLNMRSYHGQNRRAVAWSRDGGLTWSTVTLDQALIEPVCQASALRYTTPEGNSVFLFSNPASTRRECMTVRVSRDEGRTWSRGKVLHYGPSGYSDLCAAADHSICCLYECGRTRAYETITFARFRFQWLVDKQPQGSARK